LLWRISKTFISNNINTKVDYENFLKGKNPHKGHNKFEKNIRMGQKTDSSNIDIKPKAKNDSSNIDIKPKA